MRRERQVTREGRKSIMREDEQVKQALRGRGGKAGEGKRNKVRGTEG